MRRLSLFVALVALFVSGLAPTIASAADPLTVGSSEGRVDSCSLRYEDASQSTGFGTLDAHCEPNWKIDFPNDLTGSVNEKRRLDGATPTGISYVMEVLQTASFEVTTDGTNATGVHVTADLSVTGKQVGELQSQFQLQLPFKVSGGNIHVQADLTASANETGESEASGNSGFSIFCAGVTVEQASGHFGANASEGPAETDGTPTVDVEQPSGDGNCRVDVDVNVNAETSSTSNVEKGQSADAKAHLELLITAKPAKCDLGGTVRDGDPDLDEHARPLKGIRVELYDEDKPTGKRAVTDATGHYCLTDVPKKRYELRGDLTDFAHEPSIFRTVHGGSSISETAFRAIAEGDFGLDTVDLDFTGTAERPWLANAAAIHYEATRFVDWLLSSGVATADELEEFTIQTGSSTGTSYRPSTHEVYIQETDTTYAQRRDAWSECPENCEWHEIAHHVASQLGIAQTDEPTCLGREAAHGGWRNGGTCDSVQEGFASFLSTLGSLDIDAGRGPEYASPDYSFFGSIEDNGYYPWTVRDGPKGVYGKEDFKVTELLWDLVDDTPTERGAIGVVKPAAFPAVTDGITLDGVALVRLLADKDVITVLDIYKALGASDLVPASSKRASLDLDADGAADVSALDTIFLLHDFHPVRDLGVPWYTVGDPIGLTDRQDVDTKTGRPASSPWAGPVVPRHHMDGSAGQAIEFTNGSAAEARYEVAVAYPETSSHWTVVVPPNATRVMRLEIPTYWIGYLDPLAPLPACNAATDRVVTISLSGPGVDARSLTNCEYLHAAASATDGIALTFGTPVQSAAPSQGPAGSQGGGAAPVVPVVIGLGALVAIGIAALLLARRRTSPKP